MRELLEAVAASLESEVAEDDWEVLHYAPVWRDPAKGKRLYVSLGPFAPTGNRWTGSAEIGYEVVAEYVEPRGSVPALVRDEESELMATEVAQSLFAWAFQHPGGFPGLCHKLDAVLASPPDDVPREYFSRYCRVVFRLDRMQTYG